MFTIEYEVAGGNHRMLSLESSSRARLLRYLAGFDHPIAAVYEQACPITKAMRTALTQWKGTLSRNAREFAFSSQP